MQAQHGDYYRAALRYLGCIDINELTAEEQHKQAYFLGLAALLGEGVYNLGELVRICFYMETFELILKIFCILQYNELLFCKK